MSVRHLEVEDTQFALTYIQLFNTYLVFFFHVYRRSLSRIFHSPKKDKIANKRQIDLVRRISLLSWFMLNNEYAKFF